MAGTCFQGLGFGNPSFESLADTDGCVWFGRMVRRRSAWRPNSKGLRGYSRGPLLRSMNMRQLCIHSLRKSFVYTDSKPAAWTRRRFARGIAPFGEEGASRSFSVIFCGTLRAKLDPATLYQLISLSVYAHGGSDHHEH